MGLWLARSDRDSGHPPVADDRALRNWVGDYDPEHFDLDAVNRYLRGA